MNVDPVDKYRDVFHLWFREGGKNGLLQAEVESTKLLTIYAVLFACRLCFQFPIQEDFACGLIIS